MPSRPTLSQSPPHPAIRPHLIPPLAVAGAGVFSLIIIFFVFYRKLAFRRRTTPVDEEKEAHRCRERPPELRRFSFSVLRKSTASFALSHRLGQGGFGSVYRATLPSTGENVAVKLMETSGTIQGEREFHNELSLANRVISTVGSPYLVSVLGYSCGRGRRCRGGGGGDDGERKLLVYELMVNGSLQEKLLDSKSVELALWEKRYKVILDVARALYHLHFGCGPTPVIHGDVKPSNVLLDEDFNAKLGDFGLATILDGIEKDIDDESRVLVEIDDDYNDEDDDDGECNDNKGKVEEDVGSILESESAVTVTTTVEQSPTVGSNMMASPSDMFERASSLPDWVDKMSVESGKIVGKKKNGGGSGRDYWWWKQDNGGGGGVGSESGRVKDYVMEWIGTEIKKERPKSSDLIGGVNPGLTCNDGGDGCGGSQIKGKKQKKKRMDWWWVSLDEDKFRRKREKNRRPREWWKEEFCEELTKKSKKCNKKKTGMKTSGGSELWWQRDEDFVAPERKKRRKSRGSLGSIDWWLDGLSGELRGGRRHSQDWASGEIPKSGGISSTPSMRGTVCYIAPEYGGGGQPSEKCDVYSFGVLVLVIISGRRPLQVLASPMSEFERANLVSWARQLAYNGKLMDLVDSSIQSLDKDQTMLCITIALLCLQRSPCKRPNMKEILEMLTGEAEPPHLPFEFSPSPPSNFPFKSRKKAR